MWRCPSFSSFPALADSAIRFLALYMADASQAVKLSHNIFFLDHWSHLHQEKLMEITRACHIYLNFRTTILITDHRDITIDMHHRKTKDFISCPYKPYSSCCVQTQRSISQRPRCIQAGHNESMKGSTTWWSGLDVACACSVQVSLYCSGN
jgi:hypothetical protein